MNLGNHKMCSIFVAEGSEVNVADYSGKTPIHYACSAVSNSVDVVDLLLQQPNIEGMKLFL